MGGAGAPAALPPPPAAGGGEGPSLEESLRRVFGFPAFREGQRAVVERLLAGRSVLAIFPTGGGKSLCYQLPALLLPGLTLVISPLIALMKDQLDFLTAHGVPAARLDSSLSAEESRAVLAGAASGRLRLLYISPERLGNERFLVSLRRWPIALLAVDEAHCISEWGHNFRPDYLKIAHLARQLGIPRVLALTATATPPVARAIAQAFAIAGEDCVQTGFHRPNLHLAVVPAPREEGRRRELLLQRLRSRPPGPTIVYVTLQRTAEEVAAFLTEQGVESLPYHAGLEPEQRHAIQDAFMGSERLVVVATIAFGMGVDKADIRAVYHYNLPKGLESYVQEIGRAGRDGLPSRCELLACADDAVILENFTYGDTPTREAVASFLGDVLGRGESFDLSLTSLSERHDIRPLVVRTLLAYLELEGVVQGTGPFYSLYRFQPRRPSAEILARFDPERAAFLRAVLRHARKGRTWFTLDAYEVGRAIRQPRGRIVAALEYLAQQGDLELQAAGVREGYRLVGPPGDPGGLAQSLGERFAQRERHEIERVAGVLAYARLRGCRTRHLLGYFGEEIPPCGHCDHCLGEGGGGVVPAARRGRGLERVEVELVAALAAAHPGALATPRQRARYLCGLSSPATTKARLQRHKSFGRWRAIPFHQVLAFLEEEV